VAGNGYAKIIAGTIKRDNFDPSLDKYQNPNKRSRKPKIEISKLTAVELFKAYSEDHLLDRDLSHSSGVRLKGIASKVGQFLEDKPVVQVNESETFASIAIAFSQNPKYFKFAVNIFDLDVD
jgi:hypothetical protein